MSEIIKINIKVRRFDLSEKPNAESMQLEVNPQLDYTGLKQYLHDYFEISEEDDKVIKLRNNNLALVPLMNLLQSKSPNESFVIDIATIQHNTRSAANLQDAYLDSIRQKLKNIENRVIQAELIMPQIQLKRQAHMEQTVQNMSTRVAFLNKRIDELMPPQWKSKMPVSIS
ncbi:hypothetical protein FQA39_LY06250 [Lamprigera yunnana]|nr:hypothetical protein FQA39_LY06250 [Lamprigera yunnana]